MAWNEDREPTTPPPRAATPDDVVGTAEQAAYDAACQCDDTYGDYPWCPACYPPPPKPEPPFQFPDWWNRRFA